MRAPEGWRKVRLADIALLTMGQSPKSSDVNDFGSGIPFLQGNAEFGYMYPKPIHWTEKPLKLAQENDILFSVRAPVGEMNITKTKIGIGRGLAAIRANGSDQKFLYLALSHYRAAVKRHAQGSTFEAINRKVLDDLEILAPPISEQRRIAEVLSSVDEAIEATQAVIEQTRTVKQGVLNRLLTKGIGHTRFRKTETGTIPEKWTVAPLKTMAHVQTGAAKGKKDIDNPVELPYLRVANVQDGHIDLTTVKTITVSASQIERYSLQVGDVLMTEGGDFDKLGRGDVWRGQISPCLHQNHVFAVRPNPDVLMPEFLAILTGSSYGKSYFLSCAKQTTNLASINSTQVKDFPVLLPDRDEQEKIVAVVQALSKAEQSAQNSLEKTMNTKSALLSDLLTGRKRVPAALAAVTEQHET